MISPPANKNLGQHWLSDPASLQAMCDEAEITSHDIVLEIGPGPGTLTTYLARQAKKVIAVEFDEKLAHDLSRTVPLKNIEVVHADILQFDLNTLPRGYKIVANIPYYLTSHLFRILSESLNPPQLATLLVQKEVAERVHAGPGDMSLLSVATQYFWKTELGRIVPAKLFIPPPKVDSQILVLRRRTEPLFPGVNTKEFFRLVKAGFANRRKTLHNSLSAGLHVTKDKTAALLAYADINPSSRAQELSLEDWYQLYEVEAKSRHTNT